MSMRILGVNKTIYGLISIYTISTPWCYLELAQTIAGTGMA
jgi:hypothetical protein